MEKIGKENQQILLDLAAINQDRVDGYRTAIGILEKDSDAELIARFEEYMQQAQQFKSTLISLALHAEAERPNNQESGRMPWVIVAGNEDGACPSRASLLDICIQEELECKKVYQLSLKNLEQVDESVTHILKSQSEAQETLLRELQAIQNPTSPEES